MRGEIAKNQCTRRHRQTDGLHVAIEATGVKYGGGAHVLGRLLSALMREERIGRVTLFVSPAPHRRWRPPPEGDRIVLVEPPMVESPLWRVLWLEAGLAEQCAAIKPDVVLCFNGLGYVGESLPQVNFLQQPLLFRPRVLGQMPLSFRARMEVIRKLSRASCGRADRVLVQTPTVAALTSSLFGVSLSKIQVFTPDIEWETPAAICDQARAMQRVPPDRRVLYVGSTIEYKRVDIAARAVRRLRKHYEDLTLFATVSPGHPIARMEGVQALGGDLTSGEVRACLELGTMLVMPSLAETVGLPMLEAMSVGCPVIASNLAYTHDVCGDAVHCFLPGNVNSCMNKIEDLLLRPRLRQDLIRAGFERLDRLSMASPYASMVSSLCEVATQRAEVEEAGTQRHIVDRTTSR